MLHEKYGSLPILTEAFIFLADRAQHVAELVAPSLAAGKSVVSNRSWISMMAYQVYGREQYELKAIIENSLGEIYKNAAIDLAIILDIAPEVGLSRQKAMGKQFDVIESMPIEARERINKGFIETANSLPQAKIIDANRSVEEVYKDVKAAVEQVLK